MELFNSKNFTRAYGGQFVTFSIKNTKRPSVYISARVMDIVKQGSRVAITVTKDDKGDLYMKFIVDDEGIVISGHGSGGQMLLSSAVAEELKKYADGWRYFVKTVDKYGFTIKLN